MPLIADLIDDYRRRLNEATLDDHRFLLAHLSTEAGEREFRSRFMDLSPSTALSIGQNLLNDIATAFSKNSNGNWKSAIQLCLLFDSFAKSANFTRYPSVAAKVVEKLFEFLNAFRKKKSAFQEVATTLPLPLVCHSLLLFDFTLLYATCIRYFPGLLSTKLSLRKLYRLGECSSVAEAADWYALSVVLYSATIEEYKVRADSADSDGVDGRSPHCCVTSVGCFETFCLNRFYLSNVILCRKFLAIRCQQHVCGTSLGAGTLFSDAPATESVVREIFFYENGTLAANAVLKKIFTDTADIVERDFVFGRDRSVWLRKLSENFDSLTTAEERDIGDISVITKIIDKFFIHIKKDTWVPRPCGANSEVSQALIKEIDLLSSLPFDCLQFEVRFVVVRFALVLFGTVLAGTDKTLGAKSPYFCSMLKLLCKFDERDFSNINDSILSQILLRIIDEACQGTFANSEEFANRSLKLVSLLTNAAQPQILDAVISKLLENESSVALPELVSICLQTYFNRSSPSNAFPKADSFLYNTYRMSADRNLAVNLPILTTALRYKSKFYSNSPSKVDRLIDDVRHRVVDVLNGNANNFSEFYSCARFLVDNKSLFLNTSNRISPAFVDRIANSSFSSEFIDAFLDSVDHERTFSECFWHIAKDFSSAADVRLLFDSVVGNSDWAYVLLTCILAGISKQTTCTDNDNDNDDLRTDMADELNVQIVSRIDISPLSMALHVEGRTVALSLKSTLALLNLLETPNLPLKLPKKRLVRSILVSISSINLLTISDLANFSRIFLSTVDVLSRILKRHWFSSSSSTKFVGNVCSILSKLRGELTERCSSSVNEDETLSYFQCARSFSRLISLIADSSDSADFKNTLPYLLADFFDTRGKFGNFNKRIRGVLSVGVYDALDLCGDERAISFLAANLDDGAKNVFRLAYEDYKKFYRYNGYV